MYPVWPKVSSEIDYEQEFISSLEDHIAYVQEAGQKIIKVEPELLAVHDSSKWSSTEFPHYAKHFHGGGDPDGFSRAWLHHIHFNPHHWQHWIYPDAFTPKGSDVENGVVEMPYRYAREMIADWIGRERTYTGSWDIQDWLWDNMSKIRVHSKTAEYLRQELNMLGYADVVYIRAFAQEL